MDQYKKKLGEQNSKGSKEKAAVAEEVAATYRQRIHAKMLTKILMMRILLVFFFIFKIWKM
jgi:hypothetical protein